MKYVSLLLILGILFITLNSCKKNKSGTGSETSSYGNTNSHNVGSDCMKCHNTGGSNQFWWYVAGTVFKPDSVSLNPGCTVYLFTGANGSGILIQVLPVDKKSNFYTTNSVSFGTGLYAEVKSSSGEIRYMQASITNGDCNFCHTKASPILVN
jgi:hypothetical protein